MYKKEWFLPNSFDNLKVFDKIVESSKKSYFVWNSLN